MTARWHHRWRRASERVRCLSLVPRGRQECVCRASPSLPSPIPSALSMNSISNTLTPTRRTLTAHSLPPSSLRSNCSRASHETSPPSDSQSGWAAPLVPPPKKKTNATPDDVVTAPISIAGRVRLYPQFQTSFIPAVITAQTFPGPGILHLNDNRRRFLFLVRGNRRRK